MADNQNQPSERLAGWLGLVKGLTFTNVAVIAMLGVIAVPLYAVYRVLNDPALMERWQSSYRELPSPSGCTIREVKMRGGAWAWGVSAGFAYQGTDRWGVNVILDHQPTNAEVESYCASLKLIIDTWTNVMEAAP